MSEQTVSKQPAQRVLMTGRGLVPTGGIAGLGGWAYLAGWPSWLQLTLFGVAALLGVATGVNSAIACGRRQQGLARLDRVSTDDHAHLVAARRKILHQLTESGLSRRRRRDLERTLRTLSGNLLGR